jgi:hypothetical protein
VVLLFVFQTFIYQHSTYTVVDQVSEAHQTSQGAARLIERDVRNAGYMVPHAAAVCGVDASDAADVLFISDTDAIRPADLLPVELASEDLGATADTADDPGSVGVTSISVDKIIVDELASYDTDSNGTNDSDFRVGAGAILVDTGDPDRGVACGITAVDLVAPYEVTVDWQARAGGGGIDLICAGRVYRVVAARRPSCATAHCRQGRRTSRSPGSTMTTPIGDRHRRGGRQRERLRQHRRRRHLRSCASTWSRARASTTRTPGQRRRQPGAREPRHQRPRRRRQHRRVHTATVFLRNLSL